MYSFKFISSAAVYAKPNSASLFVGPHVYLNLSVQSLPNSMYVLNMCFDLALLSSLVPVSSPDRSGIHIHTEHVHSLSAELYVCTKYGLRFRGAPRVGASEDGQDDLSAGLIGKVVNAFQRITGFRDLL